MKFIRTISTLGALGLGLGLAGCGGSNSGDVHLTPGPPNPTPPPVVTPAQPTGKFVQIERLSRPAIKEVFEQFVDHQTSNQVEPYNDPTLSAAIKGTEDALRPPTGTTDYGAALQGVLYPDQYLVDLSKNAGGFLGAETKGAAGGAFGGRNINDDVVGIELGALFGNTLSKLGLIADDNQENNCLSAQNISLTPAQKSTSNFPYLSPPH